MLYTASLGILFVISFILLQILLLKHRKHVSVYFLLLSVSIILMNLGYWQISLCKTIESAIIINRFIYLGSSFIIYYMIKCIALICRYKIPRVLDFMSLAGAILCFSLIFMIGNNELYYESQRLICENGYAFMEKTYGPLHIIFPMYLLLMTLFGYIIVIYSFTQRKRVSYISSIICLALMTIVIVCYFLERILNLTYPLVPLAYVLSFSGILCLLNKIRFYDIAGFAGNSMREDTQYGFVIFDHAGRFAAADMTARNWFPELNLLNVDYKIKSFSGDFLTCVKSWLDHPDEQSKHHFNCNGLYIEGERFLLKEKGRKPIHCIRLRDDTKQQKYNKLLEDYNNNLSAAVKEKTNRIHAIQSDIIVSMASIVENRDANTGGHIQRSSDVVRIFVHHLMNEIHHPLLSEKMAENIIKAAPLHDFGKIGVADSILNKKGKFEPWEYEEMKKHSEKGAIIVEQILRNSNDNEFKKVAVNVAHYHHEKWDGNGYPCKLKGENIPFEARVMALADVFDALVSKRVYKEQFSYEKAFSIIEESCGTHFDPILCKEFLSCRKELETLYDGYVD